MKKTFPAGLIAGNTRKIIQNILFPRDFILFHVLFLRLFFFKATYYLLQCTILFVHSTITTLKREIKP